MHRKTYHRGISRQQTTLARVMCFINAAPTLAASTTRAVFQKISKVSNRLPVSSTSQNSMSRRARLLLQALKALSRLSLLVILTWVRNLKMTIYISCSRSSKAMSQSQTSLINSIFTKQGPNKTHWSTDFRILQALTSQLFIGTQLQST